MNSNKTTARVAGLFYLLFAVTLAFANVIRPRLIVADDAAATAKNIMANEMLFRIGFTSDLLSAVFFLSAAWALYALLRAVNHDLAFLLVLFNLGGVAVHSVSLLSGFTALQLSGGADYLTAFPAEQLQALGMLFLDIYKNGFTAAQLFYGAWLFPLGYLVYRSGFLPRILGILLMIGCFGIAGWFFQYFLLPGYEAITYPGIAVDAIAEFSLTFWLLIKGAKVQNPSSIRAG